MGVFTVDFTIEQEQLVLDAFDGDQAAVQAWVRERLVEHVLATQQTRLQLDALEHQRTARDALRARLNR